MDKQHLTKQYTYYKQWIVNNLDSYLRSKKLIKDIETKHEPVYLKYATDNEKERYIIQNQQLVQSYEKTVSLLKEIEIYITKNKIIN